MLEILFQNSLITVRTLNIFLALGFLFTGTFAIRYVNKHKMNLAFLTEYFAHIIAAALLVGRLVYVFSNFPEFKHSYLSVLYAWDLKFSFFGMLVGSVFALFLAARSKGEDFWAWFDTLFLSNLAMLIFVHLGYFFAGKQYGLPTSLPWGLSFEANHIPFVSPIHPTQLYGVLISVILLAYSVKKSKRIHLSGIVGNRALMLYSLSMLGVNFLHGSPSLYVKIAYGVLAALAFVGHVHCSHKTHINT